jgi:glycosyltransferase involved in cell wall biosynthesis
VRRITFIAWKDIRNPAAGGAELLQHELSMRFVRDGDSVLHLVPGFDGAPEEETLDGIRIRRVGRSVLAFPRLRGVFRREFLGSTDLLFDAFNCVGSGACLDLPPDRAFLFVYHIQGRMWRYQTSFHGVPGWIMPAVTTGGWFVERTQIQRLARRFRGRWITISKSTAEELSHHGVPPDCTALIPVGIRGRPLESLDQSLPKAGRFTVILIGPRKSKRPDHSLRAFALLRQARPGSELVVAGWGTETEALRELAARLGVAGAVRWAGRVTDEQRNELLQTAHVLITTPVKEGWGIIVVEANAMGTPAVGYDVPGLRDALAFGNGSLCAETPEAMATELIRLHDLWRDRPAEYEALRRRSLDASRPITFDAAYETLRALLPPQG